MPFAQNPYIAGNPVGDSDAFIGRADILREVKRILPRPKDNAIVLYGQRRIGKTSVLQYLQKQLAQEGKHCPVYFDLQDKAALPLGKVLHDLAHSIARELKLPPPDLGDAPEQAFQETWLPEILRQLPNGKGVVLLLDEFDVMAAKSAEQAGSAFFPYLRRLIASEPQRLNFVFVIGRNVDDLDNIALSLFKSIPHRRVSLLNKDDTFALTRLSEQNHTLHWPEPALERIWHYTNGHAFFTQQICSHVWETLHDDEPEEPPQASPELVDKVIPEVLESSRHTLEWLWDGLPPAERVVCSALAEAGSRAINESELEKILHNSGVRIVIRELQDAPKLLQDWDLLEPANGGYRFRVELLRQWLERNKPLRRVQEELNRIQPVAENFFQTAQSLYLSKQFAQAENLLQKSIELNPNHTAANQLLADLFIELGQKEKARKLLEKLYEFQPAAAKTRLINTLLLLEKEAKDAEAKLNLYEEILRYQGYEYHLVSSQAKKVG